MSTPGSSAEVARLAWPLAVGLLSFTLMGVVDTLLMGHVSTHAQAGVAVASTSILIFRAFFRGVAAGPQAMVATAHGAADQGRLRQAASGALTLALVFAVLSGLLVGLALAPLVQALLSDSHVAHAAGTYLRISAFAVPFSVLSIGLLSGIQGIGDMRTHMWVSLSANLVNAGLSAALVFGWGPFPALAEAGAALATCVSSALMALLLALRHRRRLGAWVRPSLEVLRSALIIGLPAGLSNLMVVGGFVVMNLALARAGAVEVAASQIVFQVASISFLPGAGIGEAGGVLVGRYLGAGQPAIAGRVLKNARWLAVLVMLVWGLVFAFAGESIAGGFSADPEVVRLCGTLFLFAASFQVFDAVAMVHLCALRSVGDTRFTLGVSTLAAWLFLVPSTLVLGLYLGWGAKGAWVGLTLQVLTEALLSSGRVSRLSQGRLGRMDLLLGRHSTPEPLAPELTPAVALSSEA